MREPDFRFKQFSLYQERCAMKVGTDGVLLGAWAGLDGRQRILDIGTGTGLIALIAAQRCAEARLTAIEIDAEAAAQAADNVALSKWNDRIEVIRADVREFSPQDRFDAIFCNPPFFSNSLHSPDSARNLARHSDTLSFRELTDCASRLLTDDGELHVIIPAEAASDFFGAAATSGLQPHRVTYFRTNSRKPPKRVLMTFGRHCTDSVTDSLYLYGDDGTETAEYKSLVQNLYLKY